MNPRQVRPAAVEFEDALLALIEVLPPISLIDRIGILDALHDNPGLLVHVGTCAMRHIAVEVDTVLSRTEGVLDRKYS